MAVVMAVLILIMYSELLGISLSLAGHDYPPRVIDEWNTFASRAMSAGSLLTYLAIAVVPIFLLTFAALAGALSMPKRKPHRQWSAAAILLVPWMVTIPMLLWLVLYTFTTMPTVYASGVRVTWHQAKVVRSYQSCLTPIAIALLSVWQLHLAYSALTKDVIRIFGRCCRGCGYPLKGLDEGAPCPECGAAVGHS